MGEETDSLLSGICCGGDLPFLISTAKGVRCLPPGEPPIASPFLHAPAAPWPSPPGPSIGQAPEQRSACRAACSDGSNGGPLPARVDGHHHYGG
jgi:hypothetical protein